MAFFRILLGSSCSCHEGYGQTETAGATTMTEAADLRQAGVPHVGVPFPSLEIRLRSVPEMEYHHTDRTHFGEECFGRGEIEIRGTHVFRGYFKDTKSTKEVLDDDSWLRTGDVGMWTSQGRLAIIDRKKNIFKLSQGHSPCHTVPIYQP